MFHRTKYENSFPELEEKYNVRIEEYTYFDNKNGEMDNDSRFYRIYDKTDNLLFEIDGDVSKQVEIDEITEKLEEYGNKANWVFENLQE